MKLTDRPWWNNVHNDIRELVEQSIFLLDAVLAWEKTFSDYAFIVFPIAKAYEGFLKKLFLDLRIITQEQYSGKKFRVGKALNPSLEENLRESEGVYDKIVKLCQGQDLADSLWNTWKSCRNVLFHWFPNEKNAVSFEEAKQKVNEILDTMDLAYEECKIR